MKRPWGMSFEWGGACVKMSQINAFYRNENTINLKIVSTHDGLKKFERKFKKHSVERDKIQGSLLK